MTQKSSITTTEPNRGSSATPGTVDLGNDVKKFADEATGQTKKIAEAQFSGQKGRAVEALGTVAQVLRTGGEQLTKSESTSEATKYVVRAADGIERLSGYLQSRNLSDLMRDAESFARREPAVFLGGAFVAGLIGSRFLKSSSHSNADAGDNGRLRLEAGGEGSPRSRSGGYSGGYRTGSVDDTARATLPTGRNPSETNPTERGRSGNASSASSRPASSASEGVHVSSAPKSPSASPTSTSQGASNGGPTAIPNKGQEPKTQDNHGKA